MSINASPETVVAKCTAVIKQDDTWWIGRSRRFRASIASREKLLKSLQETVREALQMNREDARRAAGKDFSEVKIAA
jgi:hypothetical protein